MFPVAHPKSAMRNVVFIFHFIDLKTACAAFLSRQQE